MHLPCMMRAVAGLSPKHCRDPREPKRRRHKLSSESLSSGQEPGLSLGRRGLPDIRIFKRSQEGEKLCWRNEAPSREMVRFRDAVKLS